MFRYMGLIWDIRSSQQTDVVNQLSGRLQSLSPCWQRTLDHSGLRVFCAEAGPGSLEPHVLDERLGVILGAVFERRSDPEDHTPCRRASVAGQQASRIVTSRGRALIGEYWGNYVALLLDPAARTVRIVKDPTGTLPCFTASFRGVTLVFSCVADCVALELPSFTINRDYLRDRMLGDYINCTRNILNEVAQVFGGECVELRVDRHYADRCRSFYWNPAAFSEAVAALDDPARAARAMRATVRSCLHTWAGCYESVLLRLSGGLDSSIVLATFDAAPRRPRLASYCYYNPRDARSDVRPWARLAVQHSPSRHYEQAISPADIDFASLQNRSPSVWAFPILEFFVKTTLENRLSAECGAQAVVTGDGGDSGFGGLSFTSSVDEYLRRHGLRPHSLRIAAQVAARLQISTWSVLRRALKRRSRAETMEDFRERTAKNSCLVHPDIRTSAARARHYPHPWFASAGNIPWGTVTRLGSLLYPAHYYVPSPTIESTSPETVSPLYSQPAVELFLRIPTYRHFDNGVERGLARRAFAADVPQPILRRLWKDAAPGFGVEVLARNRKFVRELLLDGVLAAEGLLDRSLLEQSLGGSLAAHTVSPSEIFRHLDTEIWARTWVARSRRQAAA